MILAKTAGYSADCASAVLLFMVKTAMDKKSYLQQVLGIDLDETVSELRRELWAVRGLSGRFVKFTARANVHYRAFRGRLARAVKPIWSHRADFKKLIR